MQTRGGGDDPLHGRELPCDGAANPNFQHCRGHGGLARGTLMDTETKGGAKRHTHTVRSISVKTEVTVKDNCSRQSDLLDPEMSTWNIDMGY